jgi:glycosyltransferase involved in cell wall biosynthesis
LKLLIVTNEYPPVGGGAGRTTYYLARELTRLGVAVTVLTSKDAQISDLPDLDGVTVHRVFSWRKSPHEAGKRGLIVFTALGGLRFAGLLLTQKFDLIYYFSSIPAGLLSILSPRHPSIMGLRGLDVPGRDKDSFQTIHKILKPLNLRTWRWASAVTASSANLAETAKRSAPDLDIEVFYNGVDTELFQPAPPHPAGRPFRIAGISRMIKLKGFQYLIEAMAQLPAGDFHLTLIGRGSYEPDLKALAAQLGVADRVTFAGFMNHHQIADHLHQTDLFVLPSYGDSYASAFLEAMAAGVPVIGAGTMGALELIEHGRNGWLVPPHDAPALAEAIRTLATDEALRDRLREAALDDIRREHSWEAYARRHMALFDRILSTRR